MITTLPQPPKMYAVEIPPHSYEKFVKTLMEHLDTWLEETAWDVLAPPSIHDPDYDPEWFDVQVQAYEISRLSHRHMLRAKAAFDRVDVNLCVSWLRHAVDHSMPGAPFYFTDERWLGVKLEEEKTIPLPPHVSLALFEGRYKKEVTKDTVCLESLNGEPDFIFVRHEFDVINVPNESFHLVTTEVNDKICRFPIRRFPTLLAKSFE